MTEQMSEQMTARYTVETQGAIKHAPSTTEIMNVVEEDMVRDENPALRIPHAPRKSKCRLKSGYVSANRAPHGAPCGEGAAGSKGAAGGEGLAGG